MEINIPNLISLYTSKNSLLSISKIISAPEKRVRRLVKQLINNGTLEKRVPRCKTLKPEIIKLYISGYSIHKITKNLNYHNSQEIAKILKSAGLEVGKKKWNKNLDASLSADYLNEDMSFDDILKKYPYSRHRIINRLQYLKIWGQRRTKNDRKISSDMLDEMIYLYNEKKVGSCILAKKYNIPQTVIRRALKKAGIMRRHTPRQPYAAAIIPGELEINKNIIHGYLVKHKTILELEKEFNINRNTLTRRLKYLNVKIRNKKEIWTSAIKSGRIRRVAQPSEIIKMYVYDKMSILKVAKELKIGNGYVESVLRHYGVGRTTSEAMAIVKRNRSINEIINHENVPIGEVKPTTKVILNNEQKKLITTEYEKCRKSIGHKLKNNGITKFLQQKQNLKLKEIVDIVIAFLPEASLRYKSDKMAFHSYAAYKCILLFIDHLRIVMDYPRLVMERWKKVEKIKQQIIAKQGYADEVDIIKALKKIKISGDILNKYMESHKRFGNKASLSDLSSDDNDQGSIENKLLVDLKQPYIDTDWIDFRDKIIDKLEFMDIGFSTEESKRQARAIIVETILPNENGQITLKKIGERFNMSESRMSQVRSQILNNLEFQILIKEHIGR